MTASSDGDGGGSDGSESGDGHGSPRVSPSPACCASVISANSSGDSSIVPATASPPGSTAGVPGASATTATGNSWVPSAPTSRVTPASGNVVHSRGGNPPDSAS